MSVAANVTVRATEACWRLCAAGRLDAAADLMHADFVHDDRRTGVANTLTGRDQTLENNRVTVELGFRPEFEPLAVDGDALAVVRATFRDDSGNEVVSLQVLATDETGMRTCCISFDADDLDAARSEFDRRTRADS